MTLVTLENNGNFKCSGDITSKFPFTFKTAISCLEIYSFNGIEWCIPEEYIETKTFIFVKTLQKKYLSEYKI